jgi:ureidoacrylate peracid hydrolase
MVSDRPARTRRCPPPHTASAILLVHDVVNKYVVPSVEGLPSALSNLRLVLKAAREAGLPVVFAAPRQGSAEPRDSDHFQDADRRGVSPIDVPVEFGPLAGEIIIRKPRYGAFHGSELEAYMQRSRRDTVVVCGISLAGGVEMTVRDAFNRGFRSIVIADACLCRAVPDQGWGHVTAGEVEKVTLSILAQRFADVLTTDEICKELCIIE